MGPAFAGTSVGRRCACFGRIVSGSSATASTSTHQLHCSRSFSTSVSHAGPSQGPSQTSAQNSPFAVTTPSNGYKDTKRHHQRPGGRASSSPRTASGSTAAWASRYNQGSSAIASGALHDLRTSLAASDLDGAWAARCTLVERNAKWRLGFIESRDLQRLIVRSVAVAQGSKTMSRVDPIECAQVLVAEALEQTLSDRRSNAIIPWLTTLVEIGRAEMAEEIAHTYLERLGLLQGQSGQSDLVNNINSGDTAEDPAAAALEPLLPDDPEHFPAPKSIRILPRAVQELMPILIHLHVRRYGDISRLLDLLRYLPNHDRTKLSLVHSPKRYRDTFAALDAADQRVSNAERGETGSTPASQSFARLREESLHIAELMWGIRRPAEEIGRDPIGRVFGSLAAKRHVEAMARLLDAFTAAVGRKWIWMEGTPRHKRLGSPTPDITQKTWSVIIAKLLSVSQNHLATKVWERFHRLELPINAAMYNALLLGYTNSTQWEPLHAVWAEHCAKKDEGRPDQHTYTTMIYALFKARNPEAARSLFDRMRLIASDRRNADRARIQPTIKTYNVVLHGLLHNGIKEGATELLQRMLAGTDPTMPKPQTTTLNTMMRAYARTGDLTSLSSLLTSMEGWQAVEPDIVTFTTVLDALVRFGPPQSVGESVRTVSRLMKQSKVEANTISWSALIKATLSNTGSEGLNPASTSYQQVTDGQPIGVKVAQLTAAVHALSEMLSERLFPNEVTLGSLIQASAQLQRQLEDMHSEDVHQYSSPMIYNANPALREPLNRLTVMPQLSETPTSLEVLKTARIGSALTLSFFDQIRTYYNLLPNRKTYHFVLDHALRSFPSRHPHPSINWLGELEACRITFLRGLTLLDEFCTGLLTNPLGQGRPISEGLSNLRLPQHLQEPLQPLRPLTPVWQPPPPNTAIPVLPNVLSMRLLFSALGQRLEVLLSVRDSPIYLEPSTSAQAIRSNIDNQISLTQNTLQELWKRYQVWARLRILAERQINSQQNQRTAVADQQTADSVSIMVSQLDSEEEEASLAQDLSQIENVRMVAERAMKVLEVTQAIMKTKPTS